MSYAIIEWTNTEGLFAKLTELKNKGELFDFQEITYRQLFELVALEAVTNKEIEKLFNISKHTLNTKKRKWNLLQQDLLQKNFEPRFDLLEEGDLVDLYDKFIFLQSLI